MNDGNAKIFPRRSAVCLNLIEPSECSLRRRTEGPELQEKCFEGYFGVMNKRKELQYCVVPRKVKSETVNVAILKFLRV